MNQDKLKHYQQLLMDEKRRLEYELKRLTDEEHLRIKESTGELSSYDNHPADEGSHTFEREVDLGIKDNILTLLNQVNDALTKMESGRYGICQRCGEEINDSRLEVVPATSFCERCKEIEEELEGTRERPLAEDSFYPPFRGFNDGSGKIGYDAEDAWQDVAQYGTSNTPQDLPEMLTETRSSKEAYVDATETVGSVGIEDSFINDKVDSLKEGEDKETTFTGRKGSDQR